MFLLMKILVREYLQICSSLVLKSRVRGPVPYLQLVREFFLRQKIDYQFIYFFKSLVLRDSPDHCK